MIQHTLQQPFTLDGKGLHTGIHIIAEFLPALESTGIRFCRSDMPGQPIIEAIASNVAATERGTVVKRGDAVVSTIEHTMAALSAHGIDNCLIKVNAPEVPILDGSAAIICQKIKDLPFHQYMKFFAGKIILTVCCKRKFGALLC